MDLSTGLAIFGAIGTVASLADLASKYISRQQKNESPTITLIGSVFKKIE